jgi:uncharacterized protein (TIGR02453 family)
MAKARAAAKVIGKRSAKPAPASASAGFRGFGKNALTFLAGLERNNNATWFDKHRGEWESELLEPARLFVSELGPAVRAFAPKVQFESKIGGSIFRMNRDTRFSKDKSPFRTYLDLWLWEGPNRGWDGSGFFFRLRPDELILGAGRHQIAGPALTRYRKAVAGKAGVRIAEVTDALSDAGWRIGEVTLKNVPSGFDSNHERAGLLRHGALFAELTSEVPKELTQPSFVEWCATRLAAAAPVHKWVMEQIA